MKKGFGILTAIIFLVVIGTIGTLALSISTSTTKQTSDIFLREQAELLAQSANEYAMLAYTGHDRTSNCLQEIVAYYPNDQASAFFKITMKFKYFLEDDTSKSYTNATCPSPNVAKLTNPDTRAAT